MRCSPSCRACWALGYLVLTMRICVTSIQATTRRDAAECLGARASASASRRSRSRERRGQARRRARPRLDRQHTVPLLRSARFRSSRSRPFPIRRRQCFSRSTFRSSRYRRRAPGIWRSRLAGVKTLLETVLPGHGFDNTVRALGRRRLLSRPSPTTTIVGILEAAHKPANAATELGGKVIFGIYRSVVLFPRGSVDLVELDAGELGATDTIVKYGDHRAVHGNRTDLHDDPMRSADPGAWRAIATALAFGLGGRDYPRNGMEGNQLPRFAGLPRRASKKRRGAGG